MYQNAVVGTSWSTEEGTNLARTELDRHVARIHHVGISVGDLERSVHFYRDLLGIEVIGITGEEDVGSVSGITGARARFADLDAGNGQLLELIEYQTGTDSQPRAANAAGTSHLSLRVGDMGAMLTVLAADGITPLGATATLSGGVWEGCTVVYVRDPDGMIVELIERSDDG